MIFIYPDYPVYPVKKWDFLYYELSRLRRNFFDRINKIFLFSLYLPAGRQVLNILSVLSKKWDFLYYSIIALPKMERPDRIFPH
jgi:hypothetical protein